MWRTVLCHTHLRIIFILNMLPTNSFTGALHSGSYFRALVLLYLFNELRKGNKVRAGLAEHFSLFRNEFDKFNKLQEHVYRVSFMRGWG